MRLFDGFHKIDEVTDPEGNKRERLVLKSAVGAFVVDSRGRVCLVRQYRPAVGHETWEIPAGVLDKGFSKEQTIYEELLED